MQFEHKNEENCIFIYPNEYLSQDMTDLFLRTVSGEDNIQQTNYSIVQAHQKYLSDKTVLMMHAIGTFFTCSAEMYMYASKTVKSTIFEFPLFIFILEKNQ